MAGNPYAQYAESANPYADYASAPPKMEKIGVEGLPDAVKAVWGDFNPLTQAAVGAKGLWDLAALKLKQGLGGKLTPEDQTTILANRALLSDSPMAMTGAIASGMGLTPVTAPYAGMAAARLAPALPALLQPTVPAAVTGMVANAASTPTLPGESGDTAVNAGAAGGVIGDAAMRLLARGVQPIMQSPQVQKLLNANIVPSPGSAAGDFVKSIEDKLQSLPLIGDVIKQAHQRGREELSRAMVGLSTPAGQTNTQVGPAAIPEAKQAFSNAYDKVYGNSQIGVDQKLLQGLNAAKNAPIVPMSSDEAKKFDHVIQTQILDRLPGNTTLNTADAKKVIEANLGKAMYQAQPNSPLAIALKAARDEFRQAMGRAVGPNAAELQGIDKAYSNFKDVQKAIEQADKTPGPLSGLPTPRQFLNAAKPGEVTNLARAANEVMPTTVPNSGTTDRFLMSLLLGGLGAAGATTDKYKEVMPSGFGPAFWLALGASPLLYSRPGTRYLLGDLPGQAALASGLRGLAPYSATAGALYNANQ